jgi:hypothetical protein
MSARYGPPRSDDRRLDGLRQRRAERGLPVSDVVRIGYTVAASGHYRGILTHKGKAIWRCEHDHFRATGEDQVGRTTPTFRSATRCAQDELGRRAAL